MIILAIALYLLIGTRVLLGVLAFEFIKDMEWIFEEGTKVKWDIDLAGTVATISTILFWPGFLSVMVYYLRTEAAKGEIGII